MTALVAMGNYSSVVFPQGMMNIVIYTHRDYAQLPGSIQIQPNEKGLID